MTGVKHWLHVANKLRQLDKKFEERVALMRELRTSLLHDLIEKQLAVCPELEGSADETALFILYVTLQEGKSISYAELKDYEASRVINTVAKWDAVCKLGRAEQVLQPTQHGHKWKLHEDSQKNIEKLFNQ